MAEFALRLPLAFSGVPNLGLQPSLHHDEASSGKSSRTQALHKDDCHNNYIHGLSLELEFLRYQVGSAMEADVGENDGSYSEGDLLDVIDELASALLELQQRLLYSDDYLIARTFGNIARVLVAKGNYDQALFFAADALSYRYHGFEGVESLPACSDRLNLARILVRLSRGEEADDLLEMNISVMSKLPNLSPLGRSVFEESAQLCSRKPTS